MAPRTVKTLRRRTLLKGLGAASAAPYVWVPRLSRAQVAARGAVKHLVFVRLSGGFRFTCAYNGDVDGQFNPFGAAASKPAGVEWGASSLLERSSWLAGTEGEARAALGMRRVTEIANDLCVLPCVDHEPFSARADGNHGTALERYLTGYVGGTTSFLTFVNYGVRAQVAAAAAQGKTLLPAFSLGESGMSLGAGAYAAFRPPVLDGNGFEEFSFDAESSLPGWAAQLATDADERMRLRLHTAHRPLVEAYQQTREATRAYGEIFQSDILKVANRSTTLVDGISNRELETIFGTGTTGRRAALALRLFHFGCPAVFFNEGGYDMHSGEESDLPPAMDNANRLLAGLHAALRRMQHPDGGTYWDKTLVVLGSEFGRTTGGQRFNSARGSDHSSDYATRWMSMPLMGGAVQQFAKGGRRLGQTRAADLAPLGKVYSYRSMLKTCLELLDADHAGVFPADAPITDLFA